MIRNGSRGDSAAEALEGSGGEEDGFAGAEFLFAGALSGFGLLFSEFELLPLEVGAGEVGLAVDELNVEFGFFFEAFDEAAGSEER